VPLNRSALAAWPLLGWLRGCGGARVVPAPPPGQAPIIHAVKPLGTSVPRYGRFEVVVDLVAQVQNPFDYGEGRLACVFTSPSGRTRVVDGFYFQDFSLDTGLGSLAAIGEPQWRLRFTPDEVGTWRYTVSFVNQTGEARAEPRTFEVLASGAKGFTRRANQRYLKSDDGSTFFPIGENLGWYDSNVLDYQNWLGKLSASGGNFIRVWMASWGFGLEWKDTGLGNYQNRLDRAWQLDWLLALAEQRGMRIQLCLNNHGQVSSLVNPEWADNPYNAANGGPCANTWDFFTDPIAKGYLKNRLRYLVARYGSSVSLASWELFNEADLTDAFSAHRDAVTAWHQEMARYLRSLDPYQHLITSSYAYDSSDAATWSLPELDYSQIHTYSGSADLELLHHAGILRYQANFGKPILIGELGLNTDGSNLSQLDPTGIHLHNLI